MPERLATKENGCGFLKSPYVGLGVLKSLPFSQVGTSLSSENLALDVRT